MQQGKMVYGLPAIFVIISIIILKETKEHYVKEIEEKGFYF